VLELAQEPASRVRAPEQARALRTGRHWLVPVRERAWAEPLGPGLAQRKDRRWLVREREPALVWPEPPGPELVQRLDHR
jgi:hypothetical protein